MNHIPFCFVRHGGLPFDQGNNTLNEQIDNGVENPDAGTDNQAADQHNDHIVDDLTLCRPDNLLELAPHFAETALDFGNQAFFFAGFSHGVHPFCTQCDFRAYFVSL